MKEWDHITSKEEVEGLVTKSSSKPQILFKDSTRCGISAHAKSRISEGYSDFISGRADFNYLDLLKYRSVSTFIAEYLDVTHQSPQIIVLKNGKVVHVATHHAISPQKISDHL
jgi:bacillithiol system protein YtxJ